MDIKERILAATDIADVINGYVQLKKSGSRYTACCPFHNEKTGSFTVTPSMQMWKCFGCGKGGNVIDFIMEAEGLNFGDAMRFLGKKAGIDVPVRSGDAVADSVEHSKREAMHGINAWAQQYFTAELEKSDTAKAYVESRWGLEFARQIGIGYAPDSWNGLVTFAVQHDLQMKMLQELGLIRVNTEKGTTYDFYRNRITIPIRSRTGSIIGFTARDISGTAEAKYLNSIESAVYRKSDTVFGLNYAAKEASRVDELYLVEGAPDVLRLESIDVANAVACLGARWTDEQLAQLQRYTNNLTFIPDGDVKKDGQQFATGVQAVIDNALKAIEKGFAVSVKELSQPDPTKKVDCDSEIRSKDDLAALEKQDFITWYARKLNDQAHNISEQKAAIDTIVAALVLMPDEVKAEMYAADLNSVFGGKGLVKKAYGPALQEHKKKKIVQSRKADIDLFDEYGFWVTDGGYASAGENGKTKQWSNFTLEPLFHIKDVVNPKRLFKLTNGRQTEIIELKAEDLVSLPKFKQKVEGLGNFIWAAKDDQLTKLKTYLYEQTETAVEVKQMGWHRDGFFAFGNGVHYNGTFFEADDLGIVRLGDEKNYYLPAKSSIYSADRTMFEFEKNFSHFGYNNCTLTDAFTKIATVYGDNGIVGLAFYMASLFKDLVLSQTSLHFPILNLFGPKGSGKTELAVSLKRFFQMKDMPLNLNNTTIAAIANNLAHVSNGLVHFDEFRNDLDTKVRESLKGVWDNTGRSRMNLDRDKQVESTLVDCALILSGQEMATADIALFSRFIFLRFSETVFTNEQKRNFADLSDLQRKGFSHITLQLLNMRPQVEREIGETVKDVNRELVERLGNTAIEERILGNYEVVLVIYKIISKYLTLPFTYTKVFETCYSYMLEQQSSCFKNNELNNFWECVQVLVQNGDLVIEGDFRINAVKTLKTDTVDQEYLTSKLILYMRPSRVFQLYAKQMRSLGETCLPRQSLNYYLANSKEYLGIKKSVRYKFMVRGQEVRQAEPTNGGEGAQMVGAVQYDRAMCFDYDAIMNNYGIDINSYSSNDLPEE